jgi:hypothetical protein
VAISDWGATELCTDADLRGYESSWPWGDDHDSKRYRDSAKQHIERKLRVSLASIELATDEADVLDLISNPEVLTPAACYLTFVRAAEDLIPSGESLYAYKRDRYQIEFDKEFTLSVALLHLDTDESGTIEDTEKYNVRIGPQFTRGG